MHMRMTGGDHKARSGAATATASQSILVVVVSWQKVNQDMIMATY